MGECHSKRGDDPLTGRDAILDNGPVDTTSGRDLAAGLRALLPEHARAEFDEMLDLFADDAGDVSWCGALSSLGPPFRTLVDDGEEAAVAAVLRAVDDLLAGSEPAPGDQAHGSLHDSAIACFLENVLPVRADRFVLVAPLIGPRTRRWAEQHEPWWLGAAT